MITWDVRYKRKDKNPSNIGDKNPSNIDDIFLQRTQNRSPHLAYETNHLLFAHQQWKPAKKRKKKKIVLPLKSMTMR